MRATRSSFTAAGCALVGLARGGPDAQPSTGSGGVTRLCQGKGLSAARSTETSDEPVWALARNVLDGPTKTALRADPIKGVAGAFIVHDVLSEGECDRLVALCDAVGFTQGLTLVDVPPTVRNNEVHRTPRRCPSPRNPLWA